MCATDYRANQRIKRIRVMVFNATFNNISVISWNFSDIDGIYTYAFEAMKKVCSV
jgi:hypothetical protein